VLGAITLLLVYQLIGEVIALAFSLPVPGPVIGMLLLFFTLLARGSVSGDLRNGANGLLSHLSLLFVPAGTGVMVHLARVADEWLPITAALIGSTVLTIGVTALVMRALMSRRSGA
jgi:holin-like protein